MLHDLVVYVIIMIIHDKLLLVLLNHHKQLKHVLPLNMNSSPIVTPEYGAIYNNGEGSEADAANNSVV